MSPGSHGRAVIQLLVFCALTCHPVTARLRSSGLLVPRHPCSMPASVYSCVTRKRKFSTLSLRSAVENGSFQESPCMQNGHKFKLIFDVFQELLHQSSFEHVLIINAKCLTKYQVAKLRQLADQGQRLECKETIHSNLSWSRQFVSLMDWRPVG